MTTGPDKGQRPPLLGAAVVVAAIVVMLMLAGNTVMTGRGLGVEWAGLLTVLLGVPLGVSEVRRRRAEDAPGGPALAPDAAPEPAPSAPAVPMGGGPNDS